PLSSYHSFICCSTCFDVDDLDDKNQSRIRRDDVGNAFWPVSKLARNHQDCMIANAQFADTFIPSLDHLTGAKFECKRLIAIMGTVKLHAVCQRPCVIQDHRITCFELTACSFFCDQIS